MAEWQQLSLNGLILVTMLVGLFGLVVPVFPGIVVIWLAALGYGVAAGFGALGGWLFAVISLLMLAGVTVDNVLMGAGARQGGASWTALGLGLLAGVLGTLLLPPIGGLIFAPLAIFLYEYRRLGDREKAISALKGLALGWGAAFVVRFGIGVVMIVLWGVWAARG